MTKSRSNIKEPFDGVRIIFDHKTRQIQWVFPGKGSYSNKAVTFV